MPAAGTDEAHAHAYCRQARRLRGKLSARPVELHRRLRALAQQHASTGAPDEPPAPVGVPPRSLAADSFARKVVARLDGPVLRYSERRWLLRVAASLGIRPFDANLIIAAVQHERQRSPEFYGPSTKNPRRFELVISVLVALAVECAILYAAWHVFAG